MKKVTIRDIAREANVSVGTVSKYLNGHTDMREANRRAIAEAVERLDYSVNRVARTLAHKPVKIGVLLSSSFDEYFNPMMQGIQNAVAALVDHKVTAVYERFAGYYDDRKIISTLEDYIRERVDGIILAPYRCQNLSGVMDKLEHAGIPMVLVVSDSAADRSRRLAYVGIDAALSGSVAADFAGLVLEPGALTAVFVGSCEVEEHRKKAETYCAGCSAKGLKIGGVLETEDDPELAYRMAGELLERRPELRLIYVATGNSIAVCRAICDCGMQGRVRVIATDIPAGLEDYVRSGVVIAALGQHLHTQGEAAVRTLYNYLSEGVLGEDEIMIAPDLLLPSAILNRCRRTAEK